MKFVLSISVLPQIDDELSPSSFPIIHKIYGSEKEIDGKDIEEKIKEGLSLMERKLKEAKNKDFLSSLVGKK